MPVWHARTEPFRLDGEIKVLGIIQEQHPDRCRLFMQWHQMDWLILVDSLNLLKVAADPYTVLIDEKGIVRSINPSQEEFETFVDSVSSPHDERDDAINALPGSPGLEKLKLRASMRQTAEAWAAYADSLFLWGGDLRLDECIHAYQMASSNAPDDGWLHFRMGVAHRSFFDLKQSNSKDFTKAIESWQAALELDPNQYIWRRRIQQYGPRLDKPYSFYDWVNQARKEITARGEKPFPLRVEPGGAEFAYPAEKNTDSIKKLSEPDPGGRVFRDILPAIQIESTIVSATDASKKALRIHLRLQPNVAHAFHWNNEAEPLTVWLKSSKGWGPERVFLQFPNPPMVTDQSPRSLEFEIVQHMGENSHELKGYALYNICEEINGTCLYRRQDFTIQLTQP